MAAIDIKKEDMKPGFVFKMFDIIYTVVSEFEDDGRKFWVCKSRERYNADSYSHIFTFYEDDNRLRKHI